MRTALTSMMSIGLIALFVCVPSALAKQPVTKVEITGDSLSETIIVIDESITNLFSVWNGPGGRYAHDPHRYLNPGFPEGRFVDWPRGVAQNCPIGLPEFEVVFYLGSGPQYKLYRFTYAVDVANGPGFINLDPDNRRIINHRVEGEWLHATPKWNEVFMPLTTQ